MRHAKSTFIILLLSVLLGSCTSKKNLIYFQGTGSVDTNNANYNPIFQKDDLLSITVMGLDPESVVPFNLPLSQIYNGNIGGYAQGAPTPPGYLLLK